MNDVFSRAELGYVAVEPARGIAAELVVQRAEFDAAHAEISAWPGYGPTPLIDLPALAARIGVGAIHYKDEGPRFGLGSFKALGGAYAALRILQRELEYRLRHPVAAAQIRKGALADACAAITLVSATDGNHGRSLAWGCQRFGAACRIYIHAGVSAGRAAAMADLGAEVIRIDGDYDASVRLARDEAAAAGWFVVSDTSWPGYVDAPRDVMAGYGVMTREIVAALDRPPTHVFVQGGVGGLAAAVAAGLRQAWRSDAPRVVVVEPDRAACLFASARAGRPARVAIAEETVMAGLSCGEPSPLAWEILREQAGDFLTIPDTLVAPTMRILAAGAGGDTPIKAGESAVAGLAALIAARTSPALSAALGLDPGARVLVIGSEGVTDAEIYAAIISGRNDG